MAAYDLERLKQRIPGIRLEDNQNLARWYNAIAARPATARALKKVEAIKSSRETASDDDKDRFFGRGRYARA
jgi:glutathione S-transferase